MRGNALFMQNSYKKPWRGEFMSAILTRGSASIPVRQTARNIIRSSEASKDQGKCAFMLAALKSIVKIPSSIIFGALQLLGRDKLENKVPNQPIRKPEEVIEQRPSITVLTDLTDVAQEVDDLDSANQQREVQLKALKEIEKLLSQFNRLSEISESETEKLIKELSEISKEERKNFLMQCLILEEIVGEREASIKWLKTNSIEHRQAFLTQVLTLTNGLADDDKVEVVALLLNISSEKRQAYFIQVLPLIKELPNSDRLEAMKLAQNMSTDEQRSMFIGEGVELIKKIQSSNNLEAMKKLSGCIREDVAKEERVELIEKSLVFPRGMTLDDMICSIKLLADFTQDKRKKFCNSIEQLSRTKTLSEIQKFIKDFAAISLEERRSCLKRKGGLLRFFENTENTENLDSANKTHVEKAWVDIELKGLVNENVQCYFNAAIQLLVHTPGFIEHLEQKIALSENITSDISKSGCSLDDYFHAEYEERVHHRDLVDKLEGLKNLLAFINEYKGENRPEEIMRLRQAVKNSLLESFKFGSATQQDSAEVLTGIQGVLKFGMFEIESKRTSTENDCLSLSSSEEVGKLELPIDGDAGKISVQSCLDSYFAIEHDSEPCKFTVRDLDGSEVTLEHPVLVEKRLVLAPQNLFITFKRFLQFGDESFKLTENIDVPSDRIVNLGEHRYKIVATIEHSGTIESGHYTNTIFIKDGTSKHVSDNAPITPCSINTEQIYCVSLVKI